MLESNPRTPRTGLPSKRYLCMSRAEHDYRIISAPSGMHRLTRYFGLRRDTILPEFIGAENRHKNGLQTSMSALPLRHQEISKRQLNAPSIKYIPQRFVVAFRLEVALCSVSVARVEVGDIHFSEDVSRQTFHFLSCFSSLTVDLTG